MLKLTDKSLRELGDNNVPEEILVKLNALKDRGYPRQQFFDELKELLNETELGEFQSRIVKEATGSNPYVALTLVSPTTRVEGIRFEIDGNRDNETPMIGLLLRGGKNHTIKDCTFLQAGPNDGGQNTDRAPQTHATGVHQSRVRRRPGQRNESEL